MPDNNEIKKKTSIGGQALIEGIMMRGPEKTAMAVRHVSREIKTDEWETTIGDRAKFWKLPFIRGVRNFLESMILGYKCLMKSAEMSGIEEELDEQPKKASVGEAVTVDGSPEIVAERDSELDIDNAEAVVYEMNETTEVASSDVVTAEAVVSGADKPEVKKEEKEEEKKESFFAKYATVIATIIGGVLGIALAVGLFMMLPVFLGGLVGKYVPFFEIGVGRAIFEGVIRIVLFVGYVFAVSFMKDIKRVFMYHGAEHKTIFCYEKGLPLTVENVRAQPRLHPRCGTSFMIFMLLIGIIVSIFITVTQPFLRVAIKLLTIPLIVGIGYEMIKLAGRSDNIIVRILSKPGLWLQKITTKEPDDEMIEVAIVAMNAVIPDDPTKDEF